MAEDSLYEKSDLSASADEASRSDKRSVASGREDIPEEARSETAASSDIDTSGYEGTQHNLVDLLVILLDIY